MATFVPFLQSTQEIIYIALLAVGALIAYFAYTLYAAWAVEQPYPGIPIQSDGKLTPREAWLKNGRATIRKGLEEHEGPFQVMTGTGPVIFLRNKYAEELKNNPIAHHGESSKMDFMINYYGFDGMRMGISSPDLIRDVIQRKLTTALTAITGDLVDETNLGLKDNLGDSKDWQVVPIVDFLCKLVARTSSRTFVGVPLCRDDKYLQIQSDYVIHTMLASHELRKALPLVRWIKQWSLPNCTQLRQDLAEVKDFITKELQNREQAARKARAEGKKAPKKADAIAWLIETAEEKKYDLKSRKVDMVGFQLNLALGAIHTTSQVISWALIHLCQHPEYFTPLREEIINVLGEKGWERTSLYQLKLMDSFLKESHRHTLHLAGMRRKALGTIRLHDGFEIKKGCCILVEAPYWDPKIYPDPHKFDGFRFAKKRDEPGEDNKWHYVSVQPEFMGFGLGMYACPGRFFAANETKIILSQLLMKYDWSFDGDATPQIVHVEGVTPVAHTMKMRCKRRQEEIDVNLAKD